MVKSDRTSIVSVYKYYSSSNTTYVQYSSDSWSLTEVVDTSTEGWRIVKVFTASVAVVIPAGALRYGNSINYNQSH